MIPTLIQRRGAQHLAEEEAAQAPADSPALVPSGAVLELIPESVARENAVLPLRLEGPVLYVATADASNILLRDKLSFILNKDIRLIEFPRADVLRAIRRLYGEVQTESVDSMLCEFTDTAIDFTQTEHDDDEDQAPRRPRATKAKAHGGLFGVGRSLGKTLVEFKKGMKGAEDEHLYRAGRVTPGGQPKFEDAPTSSNGEDTTPDYGTRSMLHYTVEEGQRALMIHKDGRVEIIVGPRRVWAWGKRFERMRHFVAHPGDFLVVRFRDGRQEHIAGPADVWFDPRVHEGVTRQEALQLAAKEAVVVYSKAAENQPITRRLVYGPTLFVPAPGEWLHTFAWHGAEGGSQGAKKVAKGLVFQKLWLMPDQMYHDVTDVRTADDAVLTVKLMMFFELLDIERMLETTHDPIGDFINAATSDVVDFIGHRTFEEFKKETGRLNELETYRQLAARALQNGYRVNKVVYRGYDAPARLQAMHDQAIEARTKLQLERATEEQSQSLEDFKLNAQMNRAARRRTEQAVEVDTEIELARKRQDAERRQKEADRTAAREQRRRDAEAEQDIRRQADDRQRAHLAALKDMGVDLTAFLTQGRADRVIELRGGGKGVSPHLHLDGANGEES
ncbi:MAG: twin-arginine translocase TatA/TatE family subunit [Planctomycetes bacterium]|nr:twin-arginine translocase TatA/TatE family subunit [Planctomycetota bacterium]